MLIVKICKVEQKFLLLNTVICTGGKQAQIVLRTIYYGSWKRVMENEVTFNSV